ncbi:MAG: hypothetical protein JRJ82_12255 [Deltaproteobacteria bacterium]|nr:hypothetical protein [Deltaproteobacteria bacterium]
MKKFFIVAIVALVCLGLTMPAVAKVKVGGRITQDVIYYSANDSRTRSLAQFGGAGVPAFPVAAPNPDSSFSSVDIRLPRPLNRVNVTYSNDDNTIRGFIEIRGGSNPGALDAMAGDNVQWNYAWIDWVLGPNDFFRFGRQTQNFAIRAPATFMGFNRGHIVGNNFGNVHGGTARNGVRWYHTFNDTVKLQVMLLDPDTDGAEAIKAFSPQVIGGATANVLEENVLPRLDVTVPLNFGSVRLWPSFTYLQQKYDQTAPGTEDTVDIWGVALGGRVTAGPLTFDAEITIGENLGVGNYVGAAGAVPVAWNAGAGAGAGVDSINDAKVTAWWLDVGWKIGPATIHGIVGSFTIKREDDPMPAGASSNIDLTRWMYGINVPIAVAKGFTIRPEIMAYDMDSGATVANVTEVDFGKEFLIGVQFVLVF